MIIPKKRRRSNLKGRNSAKLVDVAKLADVSPATASRALNHPDLVGEATLTRIQQAIDELGYIANPVGKALASNRPRTIGALVPSVSNPIFGAGIEAMEEVLTRLGYSLIISSFDYDLNREETQAKSLVEGGASALLLMGEEHNAGLLEMLQRRSIPFVNSWVYDDTKAAACVGFDNAEASSRMTRHLLDLGHQRFAYISGQLEHNDRARGRLRGVVETLITHNIVIPPEHLIECTFNVLDGRKALRSIMTRSTGSRPTAILCGNDIIAYGAIFEAIAMGLTVPDDVSICGFDDSKLSAHIPPGLTTIKVPSAEMGAIAAEQLVAFLEDTPTQKHAYLKADLIIRGSTASPSSHQ